MKIFLCLVLISVSLYSEKFTIKDEADYHVHLNHNYEYEMGGVRTKFADWVPYKLHKWNPKFLEDFYELYGLRLHYNENDLRKDIYFLKIGLKSRFRHPRNALCRITDEETYYKYRLLLTMHLNLQIMRSYMRIASQYDKRHLYFYNLDFAHELKNSFTKSKEIYKEALIYWNIAKENALKADSLKRDLDLGTMETERYEISIGKLDFEHIIQDHLTRLDRKLLTVNEYLKDHPGADKPFLETIDDIEKNKK